MGLERNGKKITLPPTCYHIVFFLVSFSFNTIQYQHHNSQPFTAPYGCLFGASSLKLYNLRLAPDRIELANLQQNCYGVRFDNARRFDRLVLSKGSSRCLCLSAKNAQSGAELEDSPEVERSSESTSQFTPSAAEVESLLTEICDTTSIAEFELKLGGFRLHVLRNLTVENTSSPPPVSAPIVTANVESTEQNGSASSPSLAITKVEPTSGGIQAFLDTAADEGLTVIPSPMVGYFRRSRTIKGKRTPPPCKEKQTVKEGQVICYIEQLGGELPIESDIAGEVIKILREDGDPVGYGDALIAILPSFPGIKKLQ
ncbi:putative biotin/lipoyl attachment [Helianthus annuus]|uniref:Biotin/lipoyl attachment n=1 Tax=Helianthus annuus TaxID=4232 RepID=A0A251S4I6_HELAN|nr:putative biotin/lipoyl attachment [Helianthus annuus]KAJ0488590.1 putative biotin/lipoyl attachment [Helianthus annuus]KAJ0492123.1 putative biotin/lipoyl attachment [Helianthus annuus]KAJ0504425.1 putative biotin/lipoyl attachment [Helianthus annuus]KAJ0674140.1 putative biotin/lipoyl attachment [Helianthus annuus]